MYLSDRDVRWAIERRLLIVKAPESDPPAKIDPSSIDLRLDNVQEAKIWDVKAYSDHVGVRGGEPVLHVGSERFKYGSMSQFLTSPPDQEPGESQRVYKNGNEI